MATQLPAGARYSDAEHERHCEALGPEQAKQAALHDTQTELLFSYWWLGQFDTQLEPASVSGLLQLRQFCAKGPLQVAHDAAQGEQTGLLVDVHDPLRYWFAAQLPDCVHGAQYGVLTGVHEPVRYVPAAQLEA